TIAQWFKKAGDAVKIDEPLVELETDKVTIEVPAPAAGVLEEILAADGETVEVGALLGLLREGAAEAKADKGAAKSGGPAAGKPQQAAPAKAEPDAAAKAEPAPAAASGAAAMPPSPAARKLMA